MALNFLNSGIFSGDVTVSGTTPTLNFFKTSAGDILANIKVESGVGTGGKLTIQTKRNGNTPIDALVIDNDQNATFAGNITALTGAGSGNITVGRNGNEKTIIDVGDQVNSITAYQDSDGNATHNFTLNRIFGGTGANDFIIQKDGTAQLTLDTLGNATFAGDVNLAAGKKLQYSANSFMTPENNVSGAEISTAGDFRVKTGSTPTLALTIGGAQEATFAGTVTAADLLTVNGDGHLFLGADGETPKIDMMYDDHASGAGWDTRIFIGKTDDLPNGAAFPTSTIAGGYGTQYQANSDGAFFGIIPYATGNFRPVINWGDDASDTPFSFQFNGTNIVNIDVGGNVGANSFTGDHLGTINTATTGTTQTAGDNSTKIATTAYVDAAAAAVPIGNYLPLTGGTLTGGLIGTTAAFSGLTTIEGFAQTEPIRGKVYSIDPHKYVGGVSYWTWTKVAQLDATGHASLKYNCKADTNYPHVAVGWVTISSYAGLSISISHQQIIPSETIIPQVWLDNNRDVWIRMVNASWTTNFQYNWEVVDPGVAQIYDGTTQSNTQPANSTVIEVGQEIKFPYTNASAPVATAYYTPVTTTGNILARNGNITLEGTGRIQGIDTVSATTDAANKAYVDAHGGGLGPFLPLAGGTLSGNLTVNGDVLLGGSAQNPKTITIQQIGVTTTDANAVMQDGNGVLKIRTLGTGAFGPTPVGAYLPLAGGAMTGNIQMNNQIFATAGNYGRGVFGLYNASRYQHVWSMGTAYKLSDDGTSPGNLYGIAFTHTNVGGQSKTGLSHQMLIMHNGVTKFAAGNGMWTSGNGTIENNLIVGNDLYVADQIIHTGDTNTYMQFHAADQWRVVTGGSERLEVNNSATKVGSGNFLVEAGNVGIGATSPGSKLHIYGAGSSPNSQSDVMALIQNSTYGSTNTSGENKLMFGWSNHYAANIAAFKDGTVNRTGFKIYTEVGYNAPVLSTTFASNGNVGIGTTNPTNQLHVHTNNDNAYAIRIEGSTNNGAGVWTGLGISGEANNTKSALLFEDIGASYARGKLHLCVNNELNQNSATPADAKLTVSNDGNVGIGTTSPGQKLTVSGRVLIQNTSTPFYIKVNSTYKSWVHHISSDDKYIFAPSTTDGGETWDWANQTSFSTSGVVTAKNFVLSSDKRNKTKIEDLTGDNVDISWKSFEMKGDKGEYRVGVIAQELEENHPEFVNTDDRGFKSVKYIDLLIAKIAELEARLEKLEK